VPLAELNRYSTPEFTDECRATYNMKFWRIYQVPGDVQDKLLKAYEEQEKDENNI